VAVEQLPELGGVLTNRNYDLYYAYMNKTPDQAFGRLVRNKREVLGLSQMELSRQLKWPQAKVSRVEQGKRSVTFPEMLEVAKVSRCSVSELLGELESLFVVRPGTENEMPPKGAGLTPGFSAAYESEDALLAHLERYGVRFLGGTHRPALVDLPVDEVVLAALRYAHDPRVFEALPALLLRNMDRVDWTKLVSGAYSLQLQNRLGMVVAAVLTLKDAAPDVDAKVWATLRGVHDTLAEAKLDREEVVGPRPKTEAALAHLRQRTPEWLSFWHGLGSADLESFRRYLPR
jgi:transcriptional regulator with XRE-family HTH domain